ncbi:hypothetical protein HBI82_030190 [Parastagonospora nodorum]|nr:hypothetical protein HBI06_060650 [Parastagonospora nodorum]KAH4298721.1 hypothetical protein HBI01_127600 [Parastagonospora nodorum]KAH4313549.1 hypothetical protein HBI02_081080 [Parastagonospora nodorum]KAH5338112.1 hypothetical protein HBI12_022080 [Parastagonospora nodorum]KAH5641044.1 hypothetical protein HBI22_060370 [Parastagonospora nodorum]
MSKWKDLGSGIMMWQPTADPEVDDMSIETLVAEDAQDGKIDAMETIFRDLLQTTQVTSAPKSSTASSAPSFNRHIQPQITHSTVFTHGLNSTPAISRSDPEDSYTSSSTLDIEDTSISENEFDRTDYQETPCPPSHVGKSRRTTGLTSRFLDQTKIGKKPVRRKLNFDRPPRLANHKPAQSSRMGTRPLEYPPSHRWTCSDKLLLLVYKRWYRCEDRHTTTAIFNKITGLSMKSSTINSQFAEMKGDGPKACREWKRVFDMVPFDDPMDQLTEYRSAIEITAQHMGILLHRTDEDPDFQAGSAEKSASMVRRKRYESRAEALGRANKVEEKPAVKYCADNAEWDVQDLEHLVDAEDALEPAPLALGRIAETSNSAAQLAFRVFDEYSGTSFKDGQFVAGAFVGVAAKSGGQLPHPFDPTTEDGQKAIKITSSAHFNNSGGPSCWISVFTSFLESLTKAANLTQPRIALIDLSKIDKGNTLPAHEVIRDLKKEGLAYWANTKHYAELLVWGQIKREAIIREFSLRELILLADAHHSIADLLQLHQFQVGRRTSLVATSLVTKNTRLDAECAEAMATIAEQFGLVQLRHIENLVARLVDGWSITVSTSLDIELAGVLFARKLRSSKNSTRDVASAFVKGVEEGVARLAYWSQRRGSRVRRFRTA